jgi:hypothetical protein
MENATPDSQLILSRCRAFGRNEVIEFMQLAYPLLALS